MMCCHTNKSNLRPFSRPLLSTCIFSYFFGRFYLNFTFSFSPPFFSVILVFRCFRDIFFLVLFFFIFFHEKTETHRICWPTTTEKKEKKERNTWTGHLNIHCVTLLLPITNLAPVKSYLPHYYVQEQRQLEKKKRKCKDQKKKQPYVIIMKNNIFWFILGSRSAPFLSLSFEENIYFWR